MTTKKKPATKSTKTKSKSVKSKMTIEEAERRISNFFLARTEHQNKEIEKLMEMVKTIISEVSWHSNALSRAERRDLGLEAHLKKVLADPEVGTALTIEWCERAMQLDDALKLAKAREKILEERIDVLARNLSAAVQLASDRLTRIQQLEALVSDSTATRACEPAEAQS